VPTRGIPFPTGDPELTPEKERQLRRRLLDRALEALQTPVDGPTVFDPPDKGSGRGAVARGGAGSA
jgi:glycine reductase